ncbi:replication protein A 70 kDa DNA-binding subunit B-like isoform X2 [Quercus robur]|nr:replication protein A 70 kDa DNA-binding subunit B-like isoform X2 [Quercus robur]
MIQEFTLIDQLLKPVGLIMWDQFIPNESATISEVINCKPVIIATRLKVVSHNGISLSTKPSCSFVINPNHSKATALEEWASRNEKLLEAIIAKTLDPASSSSTSIMPPIENLTDIGAITTLPKMDEIQNLENIARLSSDQEFIIHLKSTSYDVRGETNNRFNIVSIFDVPNESE